MNKPLDPTDERLLALLHANARLPLVTLAKKIDLSRSATQERLQRLQDRGVIAGFTIRRGMHDRPRAEAWMMLRYLPGATCAVMVPQLQKLPAVQACYSLAGSIDLLLRVVAASPDALMRLREQIAQMQGIAEVQTAPLFKTHFE